MDIMRKILSSPLSRRRHDQSNGTTSHSDSSTTTVSNGSTPGNTETSTTNNAVEGNDVSTVLRPRYFGVALSEVASRDGTDVPRLLLKLAHCICMRG